jgi:glycosyltransferase involved in cell wall biosynthesis
MVTLLLASFNRPHLLKLGLSSITKFEYPFNLEVIVLNDGLEDETESVCEYYKNKKSNIVIKYIFTGQRNKGGAKKRVPGFALNIGVKQSKHDIIVLSSPEVYHLNNALGGIVPILEQNPLSMVIPKIVYFDQTAETTNYLLALDDSQLLTPVIDTNKLRGGLFGECHGEMPYLMAFYKKEFTEIGGYDEDFLGYAGDDSDLIGRFKQKGLVYFKTLAAIVHLWHPGTNDGGFHWGDSAWVYNWNLLNSRKGDIIRNRNREWGQL